MCFVKIYDQYNQHQKTLILKTLEMNLEDFKTQYLTKVRNAQFNPNDFYDKGQFTDKIDFKTNKNFTIDNICFDKTGHVCSIKWENLVVTPPKYGNTVNSTQKPCMKTAKEGQIQLGEDSMECIIKFTIHYIEKPDDHVRMLPTDTLKVLREKMNADAYMKLDPSMRFCNKNEPSIWYNEEAEAKLRLCDVISDHTIGVTRINLDSLTQAESYKMKQCFVELCIYQKKSRNAESEMMCTIQMEKDFKINLKEARNVIMEKRESKEALKCLNFLFVDQDGDSISNVDEHLMCLEEILTKTENQMLVNIRII